MLYFKIQLIIMYTNITYVFVLVLLKTTFIYQQKKKHIRIGQKIFKVVSSRKTIQFLNLCKFLLYFKIKYLLELNTILLCFSQIFH